MPFALPAPVTKIQQVGVDLIGFDAGFPNGIGGVSVDNPSGSWLNVNTVPGGIYIPPLTLGFSTPLAVPKQSVDVRFVEAPFGATTSSLTGSPIAVTIYPADEHGSSGLSYIAGSPIYQPSLNPQMSFTSFTCSSQPMVDTVSNILIAPNTGFRYRLYTAALTVTPNAINPAPIGGVVQCMVGDTASSRMILQAAYPYSPFDTISFQFGLPMLSGSVLRGTFNSNPGGMQLTIFVYYAVEPG